jgi:hypothetical protein
MKYLLTILLLIGLNCSAQKNTLYGSWQPVDMGYGVRYDRMLKDVGLYASASKGEYNFKEGYIKDHYKVSTGAMIYNKNGFLSAGYNYHWYGEHRGVDENILYPVSFEVGVGSVFDRWSVALRIDPVKWDSSIDFGLRF